jgi:hypothetical protein
VGKRQSARRWRMASWGEIEQAEPEFISAVRTCFGVRKHCTMATLRRDGSPRISGTEIQLEDGELRIGSMPRALKALDLQRDPRIALHSPTVDPPEHDPANWDGEAKVAGRAIEEDSKGESHRFRIEITEVVWTRVRNGLEITSWHPDRGLQTRRR